MKTLYLPIHISGTYRERSLANKRGLRDAFAAQGECLEIDYLSISPSDLEAVLRTSIDNFQPDLLFTQIQGIEPLTAEMLARLRVSYPAFQIANWNGDVYPEHLISPDMLALLQNVDVQLLVNASVLPVYEQHGIRAAFCPFGYESAPETSAPNYDVLFLGNNYSEKRQQLYNVLRSLNCSVGIYGSGWAQAEGECNYDFGMANALYKKARIIISDNQFPEAKGYMSDRPIQALSVGGFVLQQYVDDLEWLTGLRHGAHYIQYLHIEDLPRLIEHWLSPTQVRTRARICRDGRDFVLQEHTWERRVQKLIAEWLPERVST